MRDGALGKMRCGVPPTYAACRSSHFGMFFATILLGLRRVVQLGVKGGDAGRTLANDLGIVEYDVSGRYAIYLHVRAQLQSRALNKGGHSGTLFPDMASCSEGNGGR